MQKLCSFHGPFPDEKASEELRLHGFTFGPWFSWYLSLNWFHAVLALQFESLPYRLQVELRKSCLLQNLGLGKRWKIIFLFSGFSGPIDIVHSSINGQLQSVLSVKLFDALENSLFNGNIRRADKNTDDFPIEVEVHPTLFLFLDIGQKTGCHILFITLILIANKNSSHLLIP